MSQVDSEYIEVKNLSNNSKCLAVIHQIIEHKDKDCPKNDKLLSLLFHFVVRIHDMLIRYGVTL